MHPGMHSFAIDFVECDHIALESACGPVYMSNVLAMDLHKFPRNVLQSIN